MKVLRSTFVAAVAILAAACGDKVNVVGPGTGDTTAKVNSVSVAPSTAVMAVGQTVSFSAVVDVSNGAATTVSWGSSDASKVSVSAAGVASAVAATPGVAICATSTVDANKKGCASVVVTAGTTTQPPSVSISAVNFTNGAGVQQPAPVPPGAVGTAVGVGPQLNVVMNVNAGTAILDSVVLRVGTKTAYKQSFTAAQAMDVLSASMQPETQTQGVTITGSFNTADYCAPTNANSVNCTAANAGVPTYLNGNQQFQALVFGKQSVSAGGAPSNTQGQSPVSTYRFANLDGFHATMSFVNGTNTSPTAPASSDAVVTANDQAGFKWVKGAPSVSALFVAYTPGLSALNSATSVASVLATINAAGCSAGGARTIALTNTSATNTIGPWTGTYTFNTTPSATLPAVTVNGYEFNPAAAAPCPALFTAGGDAVAFAAIGTDGNAIPLAASGFPGGAVGAGVLNTFASSNNPDPALVFRLDNVAPPAPTVNMAALGSTATTCPIGITAGGADLGTRTNCWFNDAVVLNGLGSGGGNIWGGLGFTTTTTPSRTSSGVILSGVDLGSGRVIAGSSTVMSTTFQARAGLVTDATATIDASSAITSAAALAESANNATYLLRVRSTDLMGNTRQTSSTTVAGVTTPWQFGVDRTLPTLSLLAGVANGTRIFATPAGAGGVNYNLLPTDPSVLPAIGSGFFALGVAPLTTTQSVRNAAGTLFWCGAGAVSPPGPVVGATGVYQTSSTPCTSAGTSLGVANPNTSTGAFRTNLTYSDTHASILDGYYLSTNTITDQAGNTSLAFTLLQVDDGTNSAWGGLSYSPAIIASGSSLNFTSTIGDNVDVQAVRLSLGVGTNGAAAPAFAVPPIDAATGAAWAGMTTAAGGATFWQFINGADLAVNPCPAPAQPAALCTTAPTTLVSNTAINYPVSNVFTNIQVTAAGAGGVGPFVANVGNNLMNATGFAFNQGVNIGVTPLAAGMASTVGISLGAVSPAIAALNNAGGVAPAAGGPARWVICAVSATGNCSGVAPLTDPPTGATADLPAIFTISRTGALAVPTNLSVTAVAEGTTAVFQNPFSSVQFYAYNPAAGLGVEGWRLIGVVNSATSTSDLLGAVPAGRNWYFTLNWTPNLVTAPTNNAGYRIVAIGIANGTHTGPPTQVGAALASPIAFSSVTITP